MIGNEIFCAIRSGIFWKRESSIPQKIVGAILADIITIIPPKYLTPN
jgi:hypothetical protein